MLTSVCDREDLTSPTSVESCPAQRVENANVVVMWPRIGPYHVARLQAAAALFGDRGARIVCLETAARDRTCPWEVPDDDRAFEKRTIFPETDYETLGRTAIRRGVMSALQSIDPVAVAVCGWGIPESRAAIAWCRRHRKTAILMSESQHADKRRSLTGEEIKRRIVAQCDAALVGGTLQKEYVVRLGMRPDRAHFGATVVDNEYFGSAVSKIRAQWEHRVVNPQPSLLSLQRFVWEKNLLVAMEAYQKYRCIVGGSAWKWTLCGEGPLRQEILDKRKSLGLVEQIELLGSRQIDELPALYADAGALWLPSIRETWGFVVNEAMASGLPVLVSKRAGCAHELVQENVNGLSFDPTSTDDMADCLVKFHHLTEERRRAMGEQSRRIIASWSPQQFAEGLWNAITVGSERSKQRKGGISLLDRLILQM